MSQTNSDNNIQYPPSLNPFQKLVTESQSVRSTTPPVSAELLIMMAIEDMNNALTFKTTVDAQSAQMIAKQEGNFMEFGTNTILEYDVEQIKNAGGDTNKISLWSNQFNLDQTKITTIDNQIKSVESTATTATSSDNSNMANFMQFASSAVQMMSFTIQLLQRF